MRVARKSGVSSTTRSVPVLLLGVARISGGQGELE